MKKIGLVLVLALLILFSAQGGFAYEAKLSSLGFETIDLNVPFGNSCQVVQVDLSAKTLGPEKDAILSLQSAFAGTKDDVSYVTIGINGKKPQVIWPEEFVCNEQCWARVFVPELSAGTTNIELCVVSGGSTTRAMLSADSTVGFYASPVLLLENKAPQQILLGEKARLSTTVRNLGSVDANIFVQFVKPDTRVTVKITSFDIVEGESKISTIIKAGQTREFVYYIKPTLVSSYNLPSAGVFFKNIFGEDQVIISNHPQMAVASLQQIELSLTGNKKADGSIELMAIIKNNWAETFVGRITARPIDLFVDNNKEITVLPNSQNEITFNSKKLSPGKYAFTVHLEDTNISMTSAVFNYEVESMRFPIEVVLSAIGIIAALLVFVWVTYIKGKPKVRQDNK